MTNDECSVVDRTRNGVEESLRSEVVRKEVVNEAQRGASVDVVCGLLVVFFVCWPLRSSSRLPD